MNKKKLLFDDNLEPENESQRDKEPENLDLRDLQDFQIIFDQSAHSAAHRRRAATVQKCGSIF